MNNPATPDPAPRDLRQELAETQKSLAAAQAAGNRAAYLAALERQAQVLLDSGDAKSAAVPHNLLLKFYRGLPPGVVDNRRMALALGGLAQCEMLRGNMDAATAGLKEALDLARAAGDLALEARLMAAQGRLRIEQEQFLLAGSVLQHSLAAGRQARDSLAIAQALIGQGMIVQETGPLAQANPPLLQQALQAALAVRSPLCQVEALCLMADMAFRRQDAVQAARTAREALLLSRQTGCRGAELTALLSLSTALLEQNDDIQAALLVDQALKLARNLENCSGEFRGLLLLGAVRQAQGNLPGASLACQDAIHLARSLGQARRTTRAEARLQKLLAQPERSIVTGSLRTPLSFATIVTPPPPAAPRPGSAESPATPPPVAPPAPTRPAPPPAATPAPIPPAAAPAPAAVRTIPPGTPPPAGRANPPGTMLLDAAAPLSGEAGSPIAPPASGTNLPGTMLLDAEASPPDSAAMPTPPPPAAPPRTGPAGAPGIQPPAAAGTPVAAPRTGPAGAPGIQPPAAAGAPTPTPPVAAPPLPEHPAPPTGAAIDDLVAQGLACYNAGQTGEALKLYTRALEAYRRADQDLPAQVDTLYLIGEAHCQNGALEQAIDAYNQSLALARQCGYVSGEAEALGALGAAYRLRSTDEGVPPAQQAAFRKQAVYLLEQATPASQQADNPAQLGRLWTGLAAARRDLAQYPQALECLQNAVEALRAAGDAAMLRAALLNLGEAYEELEEYAPAADAFEEALSIEQPAQSDQEYIQGVVGLSIACDALQPGELDQAIATLAEAMQIARQADLAGLEARATSHLSRLMGKRCRVRESTEDLAQATSFGDKGMQRAAESGDPEMLGLAAYNRACALLDMGRTPDAQRYFDAAIETYRQAGACLGEAKAHLALGRLEMAAARYPQALAHFEKAVALYHENNCRRLEVAPLALYGEACFAMNDLHGARQALEQVTQQASEFNLLDRLGAAWLGMGRIDLAEENPLQAAESLRSALAALQVAGDPESIALAETARQILDEAKEKAQAKKGSGLFRKK